MVRERLRSMLLQDKASIRTMFQQLDKDKDGVLNTREFHQAMHSLGIPLTDHEACSHQLITLMKGLSAVCAWRPTSSCSASSNMERLISTSTTSSAKFAALTHMG